MAKAPKISFVLADVDGTLVTEDKVLTERAQAAVHRLHDAGIGFAITSGRPPKGMSMLFDPLKLETPIAGFNGGLFVRRDLSIVEQKTLPPDVATQAFDLIRKHGNQSLFCFALAMILGGAIGNVIDRAAYGHVIDFLDFHLNTWHFATFNLADSAITLGAILLIVDELRRVGGSR